MEFKTFVFFVLATIMLLAALRVITARNPVHAVLFLVLAFFSAAGLWLLLQAEFLAIVLIMVYVGAVMVLFMFVVMLLDIDIARLRHRFWSYLPLGTMVGLLIVVQMALVLSGNYFSAEALPGHSMPADYSNTKELARLLFTEYYYPFEIAGVILLVGIIAAVLLTLRKRKDTKYQKPSEQLAVKRNDRIRMVSMPAEKDEPSVDTAAAAATEKREGQ
ncbi:MAG: NADH-quinone oxidoreductase subunit J [Gammaproteobacteria bacterium]|nr:NADH-quinone oxidoreductase subunit J [Rhodocyclaceae bacterium]MBU3908774.1 NADH-quinone oxidoreductase subunit J [Gammaproteobacteria bacterium]MBU3988434.1 NADH-quinone oxidoreductase subunit J [Gammaproteobacteria bacterium]MBU4004802.1 NADH-quinone oxidoreductase subunit J [Gammaproteobacteria bacterium]MBU4021405.1 NADH-quinone oxidoreductase subunit J [Gammaproteobacteria bacterium]